MLRGSRPAAQAARVASAFLHSDVNAPKYTWLKQQSHLNRFKGDVSLRVHCDDPQGRPIVACTAAAGGGDG